MSSDSIEYRAPDEAQALRQAEICCETWGGDPARRVEEQEKLGSDGRLRVAVRKGEVVAGLVALHEAHLFGGRAVPAWAIAAVAVSPVARRGGVGTVLMTEMLREAHREGVALSSLYPATTTFYRRLGYEQAGEWREWELSRDALAAVGSDAEIVPFEAKDPRARELYARRAAISAGTLRRSEHFWTRAHEPSGHAVHRYLVCFDGRPEGYWVANRERSDHALFLRDAVALTPRAGQAILAAAQRANVRGVRWWGGPMCNIARGAVEFRASVRAHEDWMLRVIDADRALRERGYPAIDGELHLEVRDDVIGENGGRWILSLNDGEPTVERGGGGLLQVDIRALSAMYSGHMCADELRTLGLLEGDASQATLATAMFAGPRPWMADRF